jgi:bifunctional non-homologous end joining protein LigD
MACIWRRARGRTDYPGKVHHGYDKDTVKELQGKLEPRIRKNPAYSKRIHRGIWVSLP